MSITPDNVKYFVIRGTGTSSDGKWIERYPMLIPEQKRQRIPDDLPSITLVPNGDFEMRDDGELAAVVRPEQR